MTHGTVKAAVRGADGVELEVEYPGGTRWLIIPPECVKITVVDLLSRDRLEFGVTVGAVGRKGEDGVVRAGRATLSQ